jgi:uncharacterized YccA/Bax inhibitor family protein
MRTSNPVLQAETFTNVYAPADRARAMTIQGTVDKTGILLACVLATAIFTWNRFFAGGQDMQGVIPFLMGGTIGGLIFALATTFKPTWAPITAPLYGLAEGLFLGSISAMLESQYPGIALQAVALTFGTLLCMLLAYRARLVQATERFKMGVVAATGAICLVYLVTMLLGFFGIHVPYIHAAGPIGIAFSVFVVVIAALNLVLDFDLIETGAERGAPKYMEWYGAFALMVTLIWLYLEILRLLAKLRSRD